MNPPHLASCDGPTPERAEHVATRRRGATASGTKRAPAAVPVAAELASVREELQTLRQSEGGKDAMYKKLQEAQQKLSKAR